MRLQVTWKLDVVNSVELYDEYGGYTYQDCECVGCEDNALSIIEGAWPHLAEAVSEVMLADIAERKKHLKHGEHIMLRPEKITFVMELTFTEQQAAILNEYVKVADEANKCRANGLTFEDVLTPDDAVKCYAAMEILSYKLLTDAGVHFDGTTKH